MVSSLLPYRSELAQARVIVRAASHGPVEQALVGADREVVDRGDAPTHQAAGIELPVLVAEAPVPLAAVIAPFIGEADGDADLVEGPDLLDQPVFEFARPFPGQELDDRRAPGQEFGAVAPLAVGRVGERDALRIAAVPGVLGKAGLLWRRSRR
jgi:hypothetical protein